MSSVTIKDNNGARWVLGRRLGSGWSSHVYAATSKEQPDLQVAVKMFVLPYIGAVELEVYLAILAQSRLAAYKEAEGLPHLGFPKMYGHGDHMVVEGGVGMLRQFIVLQRLFPLTRDVSIPAMCAHLIEALVYLHSCGWVHNDIYGINIMVDDHENFYFIDFERAVFANKDTKPKDADFRSLFWALGRSAWWPRKETLAELDSSSESSSDEVGSAIYKKPKVADSTLSEKWPDSCTLSHITPQYSQAIEKDYIKDISTELFLKLVGHTITQLEQLHKSGYCHNNIHPDNVRYDASSERFILVDLSKATKIQSTSSAVEPGIYSGLDSYKLKSSPRNDLDAVVFCMMYWAGLKLPWAHIDDPKRMHTAKIKFMGKPCNLLETAMYPARGTLIGSIIKSNTRTHFAELPDYGKLLALVNGRKYRHRRLNKCFSYCSFPSQGGCGQCWSLHQTRDTIILGLPDERSKQAIATMTRTKHWFV